jgi:hypothetical protein
LRLAAALIAALVCGGCSLTPERPKSLPPPPSPPNGSNRGKIGDSIRLAGSAQAMRVRVLRVIDPVPVGPSDATLDPSARFVGVELELDNLGPAAYNESPLGNASLLTDRGGKADPGPVLGGPCGGGFASHVKIPPGGKRRGCLAFEVAPNRRPATFGFALDSGFAEERGRWRLR